MAKKPIYRKKWKGTQSLDDAQKELLAKKIASSVDVLGEGCWIWKKATFGINGYGAIGFRVDGKHGTSSAHRASYMVYKGPIPEDMCVCHTCDNRRCVNPDHLWLGSKKDNAKDAISKGRWHAGETHPLSVITDEKARAIYELANGGKKTGIEIAAMFGVSPALVSSIKLRRTYRSATECLI